MGQPFPWLGQRRRHFSGWILTWNILLSVMFPVEAFRIVPTGPPKFNHGMNRDHRWPTRVSSLSHTYPYLPQQTFYSVPKVKYLPRLERESSIPSRWGHYVLKRKESCDGKENLLNDLGVLSIVTGVIGTVLGIFSASYLSVVGNTISIISGIISYATGIPSAIITYLAAQDRLSYTIANVLSLLSLANTAYGFWSVNFGNYDIFTSQVANLIGSVSLALSIITAYPELFDGILYEFTKKSPDKRREVNRFVRNYGCSGSSPTFYEITLDIVRQFTML